MEIYYKTEKLRNLCENKKYSKELVKKYGSEVAKNLPLRIVQLKAFESVNDIPVTTPFRRHKLKGNRQEQFAVNITEQYRLIFR